MLYVLKKIEIFVDNKSYKIAHLYIMEESNSNNIEEITSNKIVNNDYSSDSSCEDIKITLNPIDTSKMTPEELAQHEFRSKECDFCISIHRKPEQYIGHTLDDCRALKKIRCNFCGLCGHTGSHCKDRKPEDEPIRFNCSFCFRANKEERFYMSHTINECRYREKYNSGKKVLNIQL